MFCTLCVELFQSLDRHSRVTVVPYQNAQLRQSAGLTIEQCQKSVWTVAQDGTRYPGAAAIHAALARIFGSPLVFQMYQWPLMKSIEDTVYRWVASRRHRLPGRRPYCKKYPEECIDS